MSVWVSNYMVETYDNTMSLSVRHGVFGMSDVSEFIKDKPGGVLFKRLGTMYVIKHFAFFRLRF